MIELYHADRSTCSQKVRLCAAELGLDYTSHPINLMAGEQLTPAFLAVNPNGVVPALMHDGEAIIESSVICEYLCEVFPDEDELLPTGPVARAHMRAWLRYIDELPSMAVRVVSFQKALLPVYQKMTEAEFETYIDAMPVRKYFFQKMGRRGFDEQEYGNAIEQLQRTLARVEMTLEKHCWLVGDRFSIADICLLPVIQRLADLEMAWLWQERPRVTDWLARSRARPSYGIAFYSGSGFTLTEIRELLGSASSHV